VSHRDAGGHTAPPLNVHSLKAAFDWLLEGVEADSITFRAEAKFSPRGLMLTALLWVWAGKAALGQVRQVSDELGLRCGSLLSALQANL